jgi:hypothetical protein
MGKLSDAMANMALDLMFGKAANNFPTVVYVGLSSTTPTNTGTNVTEPSTGNYARVAVSNSITYWPAASSRAKSNGYPITFPLATADWASAADMTHFVIYDAASNGNFIAWGALDNPAPVLTGIQASFAAGTLTITMPGT